MKEQSKWQIIAAVGAFALAVLVFVLNSIVNASLSDKSVLIDHENRITVNEEAIKDDED